MITIGSLLKDRPNLYSNLGKLDIITKMRPLLKRAGYIVRPDGKIVQPIKQVAWESPWIHSNQDNYNECSLCFNTMFEMFKFWPTYCLGCWKLVIMPRTLSELFDVYEYQRECGHPCKCGIEVRDIVNRLYGGYFYHRSREYGLIRFYEIRKVFPDTPMILKRGCSEFETELGPAEDWEVTAEQLEKEDVLKQWVIIPDEVFCQPDHLKAYIMLKWIHFAYTNSDETYKQFTRGQPLSVPMKTYHQGET